MTKAEQATKLAIEIAEDNKRGYLWGGNGPIDFDCSGLVNYVYTQAGVRVNSEVRNTTQTAPIYYVRHGFRDVTGQVNLATGAGLRVGDVLDNRKEHMAIYVGDGQIVQARSNLDGKTGDSSGQEILVQPYYNFPWDCVLRYVGEESAPGTAAKASIKKDFSLDHRILRRGCKGEDVRALQFALLGRQIDVGPDGADGDFGGNTEAAVITYQKDEGLLPDGEVGEKTQGRLDGIS